MIQQNHNNYIHRFMQKHKKDFILLNSLLSKQKTTIEDIPRSFSLKCQRSA
jgi:hypothetical protein